MRLQLFAYNSPDDRSEGFGQAQDETPGIADDARQIKTRQTKGVQYTVD